MAKDATAFYSMTTKLEEILKSDESVNTVTYGDLFEVALDKQTLFPLSHFVVNNVTVEEQTYLFNVSLICMDVIDFIKDETTDKFNGNDNQMDIFNTQLAVITRAMNLFQRYDLRSEGYELVGQPTTESFNHRFEDDVCGWVVTFDIRTVQRMEVCG